MAEFGRVIVCGKHQYSSEAAFSLVNETNIEDPVAAVEYLADDLLRTADVVEPPIPLEMVASFQGVKTIINKDMLESGRLVPVSASEYRIELRNTDPVGRQNFTVGHEIGHTLIPFYSQSPTPKSDLFTGEFHRKNEEEFFCDIAARNLLLPEQMFREHCGKIRPSIEGLLELSSIFQASIEAVAIRLDQLLCWNCIPVVWELRLKPTQKHAVGLSALPGLEDMSEPIEEYRVKFPAGGYLFPTDKHVAMDSRMVSGCLCHGEFKGSSNIPTSKHDDTERQVEATVAPYRDEHGAMKQRIVSLIFT